MQIVDAQIHTWGSGLPSNMSHWQVTHFTPQEAIVLMDEGGVDAAVIHPPGWDPNSTEMAFRAVRDYPGRFAIMGALPLDDPDIARPDRDMAATEGNARSALYLPARSGAAPAARGRVQRALGRSREGRGADRDARHQLARGTRPYRRAASGAAPDDRSSRRKGRSDDAEGRRGDGPTCRSLLALAKYPNVAVKATGAPGYSAEPYPYPTMQNYLRQIFDAFGPHRMFWGTDITKMPCSWRQCVTMFTEELPWLGEDDKRLVMGDALCAWWGWDRAG